MNPLAVVEPAADELENVRDGFRRLVGIRLELEGSRPERAPDGVRICAKLSVRSART